MKFKFTDYHVHTAKWSSDIAKDGPNFEDYIKIAESNEINICFLDHFEFYSIENDKTNFDEKGKTINCYFLHDTSRECLFSGQ